MSLCCPKCGAPLVKENASYHCCLGHSYDIARQGYVNLLLANQKHSAIPGDEKQALLARQAFLQAGYYEPLARAVSEEVNNLSTSHNTILDAGCGTGYYTAYIADHLNVPLSILATDISKTGTAMTAKNCPSATCFVSSVFHLPLADKSINGIISIFCPYSGAEFDRVLADGGWLIVAGPGPRHLWEMKKEVYQTPYDNPVAEPQLPNLTVCDQKLVTSKLQLLDSAAISALWMMTPYYHTTSPQDTAKLLARSKMEVTMQIALSTYRKESK